MARTTIKSEIMSCHLQQQYGINAQLSASNKSWRRLAPCLSLMPSQFGLARRINPRPRASIDLAIPRVERRSIPFQGSRESWLTLLKETLHTFLTIPTLSSARACSWKGTHTCSQTYDKVRHCQEDVFPQPWIYLSTSILDSESWP